jgi:hypothetical protein
MRKFSVLAILAAILLCGSSTSAQAAATYPAVPPTITAVLQGNDIVFTFPEGTDHSTVSIKYNRRVATRHIINHHHRQAFRWVSPTELHVAHHFFHKYPGCHCHPHEGIWVEGEAHGYVALLQFVVVQNLPLYDKVCCCGPCKK